MNLDKLLSFISKTNLVLHSKLQTTHNVLIDVRFDIITVTILLVSVALIGPNTFHLSRGKGNLSSATTTKILTSRFVSRSRKIFTDFPYN